MHYAIAIAVLASLGTIGLAAPQNDAGDNSRCGISLFIGSGNPTCNVNTSNQPGGHGQSADLTINGDCAASGSTYSEFSATDPTFGTMSFEVSSGAQPCNSDDNGGYCGPLLLYGGNVYDMIKDPACTNGGRHPEFGTHGWWWRCQVTCPPGA